MVLLIVVISFAPVIGRLPMTLLVRDDQPEKGADYILVMMGSPIERAEHAARLYRQGYGSKIIFAEAEFSSYVDLGYSQSNGQITLSTLLQQGVSKDDIIFLKETRNTSSQEEVLAIARFLQNDSSEKTRVLLVTSWYHSSRATWIASRVAPQSLDIQSSPSPAPDNWWAKESHFLSVFNEYLKWTYYLIKY